MIFSHPRPCPSTPLRDQGHPRQRGIPFFAIRHCEGGTVVSAPLNDRWLSGAEATAGADVLVRANYPL